MPESYPAPVCVRVARPAPDVQGGGVYPQPDERISRLAGSGTGAGGVTKTFINHKTGRPYKITGGATPAQMENSATQFEMCFGLARQTIRVIDGLIRKQAFHKSGSLVAVKEEAADGAHYAAGVTDDRGHRFVIDWWMTLDLDDPVVLSVNEWKVWPHGNPIVATFKQLKMQASLEKLNIKLPSQPARPSNVLLE